MIKRRAQRIHAKKRFLERTGHELLTADLEAIILQIQQGRAVFVKKQSNRVSHWEVDHQGTPLRVVYDKSTKQIVTILLKGG